MPNKILGLLIFSLLLLNFLALTLIQAQEDLEGQLPISPDSVEKIKEDTETKWDYLSRHWKIILLNNPIIRAIDSAFTKLDSIGFFVVLFAVHWQLSFTIVFSIILWIFFLIYIKRHLKKLSGLNSEYCYLIALASVLFLAWTKIFLYISKGIFDLFTTTKGKIILTMAFLVVLWLLFFLDKFGDSVKKAKQAGKVSETEAKMKRIEKFQEGFEKGSGI